MNKKILIKNENIESKCKWSPFNEMEFKGKPVLTVVNGKIKMKDGKILGGPNGQPLFF
jgi:dihydroorotase